MTIYIDCPIPIPPFVLLSNNCSYYKNENGKSQDADNGKRAKREGQLFRVAPIQLSYHTNIWQVNKNQLPERIFYLLHYFLRSDNTICPKIMWNIPSCKNANHPLS